jgi:hypothetical protein
MEGFFTRGGGGGEVVMGVVFSVIKLSWESILVDWRVVA